MRSLTHSEIPVLFASTDLPFADVHYLRQVIGYLRRARIEKGMSLHTLARRARLKLGEIDRAERCGGVLKSREFRAWSGVLGLSWDQIWSECNPVANIAPAVRTVSREPGKQEAEDPQIALFPPEAHRQIQLRLLG